MNRDERKFFVQSGAATPFIFLLNKNANVLFALREFDYRQDACISFHSGRPPPISSIRRCK